MKAFLLICAMTACNTLAIETYEGIALHSYFGKGFGRVIEQKANLKSMLVEVCAKVPPEKQWFLFKSVPNDIGGAPRRGIRVIFASKEAEDVCNKLAVTSGPLKVQVTGYESVISGGEANTSKEVSSDEFESISSYSFRIETVFIAMSIKAQLEDK